MSSDDKYKIKQALKSHRKTVFSLEEVIDMLAKIDDNGHSERPVYIEGPSGERFAISYIELDKSEKCVVIA